MKIAIKSFLWVSSSYDEPGAAAYQIDLVETAETMAEVEALGGLTRVRTGLNVAQAAALGIDLAIIGAGINTDTLAGLHDAEVRVGTALDALAAAIGELEETRQQLSVAAAGLATTQSELATSVAAAAALADQVRALTEQVRALEAQPAP